MSSITSVEITRLLKAWGSGDGGALEKLTPLVHDELRRLARNYMRRERQGHTLQATALVNEAYLRLVDIGTVNWQDRAHFFAISAKIMRRILMNAARARGAEKRGGPAPRVNLDDVPAVAADKSSELVALDDALQELAKIDPRRAQVVELRFFGGLSVEETGEVMKISPQTVMRDWQLAKAWMRRELSR